jgi:5'-methylthioadenosine phosphorylase
MIGIIGGTGLGDALAARMKTVKEKEVDTPFGLPSGPILLGTIHKTKVAFLNRHGEGHKFNPSTVPYQANIFALKKLGVTTLLASGAVGSLRNKIQPKDVVMVDQIIDKTWRRTNTFFDRLGAVHVEMAEPCCERLRQKMIEAAGQAPAATHPSGTYVCIEGPQFSTRAESRWHHNGGCSVVGMTAMPEAKLAREAQMCYALIALVTDYDCWRKPQQGTVPPTLIEEILGNLKAATDNAIDLIASLLQKPAGLCDETCPCRKSLELAVWTKPDVMNARERQKLAPLFE